MNPQNFLEHFSSKGLDPFSNSDFVLKSKHAEHFIIHNYLLKIYNFSLHYIYLCTGHFQHYLICVAGVIG